MRVIFYRYGNICEPDVLNGFHKLSFDVIEDSYEIENKFAPAENKLRHFAESLICNTKSGKINFVFSMNFFPYVSELCEKLSILYVCWSADCPVLELYSKSLLNDCNRIFLFDMVQYQELSRFNPEHVYYLPLATNVDRWDKVLANITPEDKKLYTAEVSFVGSLYREKSPLSIKGEERLPLYMKGYVGGVTEAQLQIYGYNFLQELVTEELVKELKCGFPDFYKLSNSLTDTDCFVAANYYLGMLVSEKERVRLLKRLSEYCKVTLYTRSDTKDMGNVICRDGITTHVQMPKVFRLSKINLNITMKGIQSGLPLRIYDVMGCGGFLLSNYQAEIPTYFEVDKDLVCYDSVEDCIQKVNYYLQHEEERQEIAKNGYNKVRQLHTYEHRILNMLKILYADAEEKDEGIISGVE